MRIQTSDDLEKFIFKLQKPAKSKITRYIELLEDYGFNLKMPYSKRITANLYELRIHGQQEIRIFYTIKRETIFLLHGFIKRTNKTPRREIETALNRLNNLDI
jgi:phage-related protein